MTTVNDRVSEVISRFEAYIGDKTNKLPQPTPAQSHNVINATVALPIASDSQPASQPIVIDLVAKSY